MTEEQLNRGMDLRRDLKLAKEALGITETTKEMDLIFRTGNRYDMRMNKVFHELIYPDLKLYLKTFCEIRLTMLIKNWEKELSSI